MALTDRLDATAVALAHILRANQAYAHPDEHGDPDATEPAGIRL